MSRRAWLIDPWAHARSGADAGGELAVADLPRLAVAVQARGAVLAVSLSGSIGVDGRSYLRLGVKGEVWLVCQRCLEPVQHAVAHDVTFQLWPPGQDLPDEELAEDAFDALPVGNELDVAELVEDEVLLGLPLAPRHADCSVPAAEEAGARTSPFDVLKQLKRPQ